MNPEVANVLICGCVVAVLCLCSFVAGFVRGVSTEWHRVQRESRRQSVLDRLKPGPHRFGA